MTAAQVLAALRAEGCDLTVLDSQLYSRGFDWTLDKYTEAIEQHENELIALLEREAALAEVELILRGAA